MESIPIRVWGAFAFKCDKTASEHPTLPCDNCKMLGFLPGKYMDAETQASIRERLVAIYPGITLVAYGQGDTFITEDIE